MDTMRAFMMGQTSRDKELMVFDWDKAAELIREKNPKTASAGLSGDWGYTGGEIYQNGKIVKDEYTFLASTWATPELDLDGEVMPCYRLQSATPKWNAETKWPKSARHILSKSKKKSK